MIKKKLFEEFDEMKKSKFDLLKDIVLKEFYFKINKKHNKHY